MKTKKLIKRLKEDIKDAEEEIKHFKELDMIEICEEITIRRLTLCYVLSFIENN